MPEHSGVVWSGRSFTELLAAVCVCLVISAVHFVLLFTGHHAVAYYRKSHNVPAMSMSTNKNLIISFYMKVFYASKQNIPLHGSNNAIMSVTLC